MKLCAIVLFCVILLSPIAAMGQTNSKLVEHARVTIYVSDPYHSLLGSKTFSIDATSPCQPTLPEPLSLWFTLGIPSMYGKDLFSDIPLIDNLGKTFCIDSSCGYPDYTSFVLAFTDGIDEYLTGTFSVGSAGTIVSSSTEWVWDKDFSALGTDFQGERIGKICMHIDEASIEQKPCLIGVPEPHTWAIMLSGFACSIGLWARRRQKTPVH